MPRRRFPFTVPKIEQDGRKLYLVMESRMDGKTLFREEATYFKVESGNK